MTKWRSEHATQVGARALDASDPLRRFREQFVFPETEHGSAIYFAGHSLGLMPKLARSYIEEALDAWGRRGVEGHHRGEFPWLPYHEFLTPGLARLVGARESEVVAMNSLTVNLHLLLVSFYRPTAKKFKILIENGTFPSDRYAVDSQARFHGFAPQDAIVELKPEPGESTLRLEAIEAQIHAHRDSLALVLLGNCNYLTGQCFDFARVILAARNAGARVGFNLAHGAGNLHLQLHDWAPDFAVWCSYKYLNAGAGGVAGAFVHETHLNDPAIPRFEGWWGHNKQTRFKMEPGFDPLPTVEAWQLSNPPIFQLASLRASLELFDAATMTALRTRGDKLTTYFEWRLKQALGDEVQVVTPSLPARGSMLCLRFRKSPREAVQRMAARGVFVDFREPDILRATPAPLYTSFEDVWRFVEILGEAIQGG